MGELFTLFLGAAIINNIILTRFLGMCPFLGVSKKSDSALGMGAAVTFVIVVSSIVTYFLYNNVLVLLGLEYMDLITFILVIASFVQLVEMIIKKFSPALYKSLGIFLPLITTNCVVLFVAQQVAAYTVTKAGVVFDYNFGTMLIYALATALGFMLVITLFSFIRVRIDSQESTPKPFKGNAIALITTALMVLAFAAFTGLV
mgnify:CR=1 FL=1